MDKSKKKKQPVVELTKGRKGFTKVAKRLQNGEVITFKINGRPVIRGTVVDVNDIE